MFATVQVLNARIVASDSTQLAETDVYVVLSLCLINTLQLVTCEPPLNEGAFQVITMLEF